MVYSDFYVVLFTPRFLRCLTIVFLFLQRFYWKNWENGIHFIKQTKMTFSFVMQLQ